MGAFWQADKKRREIWVLPKFKDMVCQADATITEHHWIELRCRLCSRPAHLTSVPNLTNALATAPIQLCSKILLESLSRRKLLLIENQVLNLEQDVQNVHMGVHKLDHVMYIKKKNISVQQCLQFLELHIIENVRILPCEKEQLISILNMFFSKQVADTFFFFFLVHLRITGAYF